MVTDEELQNIPIVGFSKDKQLLSDVQKTGRMSCTVHAHKIDHCGAGSNQ